MSNSVGNAKRAETIQSSPSNDEDPAGSVQVTDAGNPPEQPVETISKNQVKKRRRLEKLMEIKKRRKLQDKEVKLAKAKLQGRDLEEERKQQEAGKLKGVNRKRKREAWEQNKVPLIQKSFQICLDCGFESTMTFKEINSLALQIRSSYAANKRNAHPCQLTATSVSGTTLEILQHVSGFEEWSHWAFTITSKSVTEHFAANQQDKKIIYLTSDSETVLSELNDDHIYVIGGIVDRNRLKYATLNRAKEYGFATARLPITEHLQEMAATRVLTCNHVVELLLEKRHKSWKDALQAVLPQRKNAKFVDTVHEKQMKR
jgi:tRNA (guanine9-N1)-methyltransferase